MMLRFWRRKNPAYIARKPSGLLAGDRLYASGVPHNVTPPAGWTWDDVHGWHKIVGPQEPMSYVFTPRETKD